MQENALLEQLRTLLKRKKSNKYYAEKLGTSIRVVEELRKDIKELRKSIESLDSSYEEFYDRGEIKLSVASDRAMTIDELMNFHKIDSNKYKVGHYWSIFKSGKFHSSLNASLKKPKDYSPEDFAKFLSTYKPSPLPKHKCVCKSGAEVVDVELSIADFHLGKKTIDDETLFSRRELFMDAIDWLLSKTSQFSIRKIVFPISNDFFHTDTYQNTTTNGTPQDVLTSFDHEYEEGFDLLVTAITVLARHADEVEVVLVQGNHDRTKSFYLAHALEVQFKENENIFFQRQHSTTKSVVLGDTFIGYHHGNCKIDELPLIFSTGNDSFNFGLCKYREVHTGDKHHYMAKEIKGVRIQQMPSLSGVDRWHGDMNFVNNIRAGLILIYHPEKGKMGEFEYRIG